ncbi:sciellin [Polymixia lowei]
MSSYTRRSYTTQTSKSTSPSQAIEDSKKKSSLLKDSSWIRKDAEEDEPVDRDPNFGRSVLSRYRSNEALDSTEPEATNRPKVSSSPTSVQALTKRFSTSQDELNKSSTLPSSYGQKTTSYTRSSTLSSLKDAPNTTTTSKTIVKEEPKTSTTTTSITKNGNTTETTVTTSQSVSRSPVIKTPTKTDTFTERVFSDVKTSSKGTPYSSYTPTKSTKVTEKTVTTNQVAEDQLFDTLIPKSIKNDYSTVDSKISVSKTETVKTSNDGDGIKTTTTTTTRTPSTTEDSLYDTLLPQSMKSEISSPVRTTRITNIEVDPVNSGRGGDIPAVTSPTSTRTSYTSYSSDDTPSSPSTRNTSYSSKPSDDYTSTRRTYSSSSRPDSSYEYTSVTSPTVYTTTSYKDNSRVDDQLADNLFSKSSIKTVYSAPERKVLEKDLCSYCRKPFNSEAKMVLEDMKINCHASCFKCEVCNNTLGHLKAGDSMWIYRRTVHCDNCFDVTREKWRR